MYEYQATLISVVDGDTIHAQIDVGLDIFNNQTLRFAGINAVEIATPTGPEAKQFVVDRIPVAPATFVIRTAKDRREKYGRYLAWIQLPDGTWLNELLLSAKASDGSALAVPYGNLPATPPS